MTAPPRPSSSGRIVITGGGTAGHTNPGIAVAEALVDLGVDRAEVQFVGGERGNERDLVPEAGFAIELLPGRGIERKISLTSLGAVASLLAGMVKGFWLVLRHRPRVVLCLGGYAAVAVSLAAVVLRVPVVVTEQNAKASAVNRLMGRWARVCAIPFPDTDLPKAVLTGNPTRAAVVDAVSDSEIELARQALDLPLDRVVVAVWSGSLGATSVNRAGRDLACRWADRSDIAIRHVVGRRDWGEFSPPPPEVVEGALIYQLVEYEDDMPSLLVAADVAVCRAGASTVAELAMAGLPSVLVPLPIAPRDHQRANASELVGLGSAILIDDHLLDAEVLATELEPMINDAGLRQRMAQGARSVARPEAARRVAGLVLEAGGFSDLASASPLHNPERTTDGDS